LLDLLGKHVDFIRVIAYYSIGSPHIFSPSFSPFDRTIQKSFSYHFHG